MCDVSYSVQKKRHTNTKKRMHKITKTTFTKAGRAADQNISLESIAHRHEGIVHDEDFGPAGDAGGTRGAEPIVQRRRGNRHAEE